VERRARGKSVTKLGGFKNATRCKGGKGMKEEGAGRKSECIEKNLRGRPNRGSPGRDKRENIEKEGGGGGFSGKRENGFDAYDRRERLPEAHFNNGERREPKTPLS